MDVGKRCNKIIYLQGKYNDGSVDITDSFASKMEKLISKDTVHMKKLIKMVISCRDCTLHFVRLSNTKQSTIRGNLFLMKGVKKGVYL